MAKTEVEYLVGCPACGSGEVERQGYTIADQVPVGYGIEVIQYACKHCKRFVFVEEG